MERGGKNSGFSSPLGLYYVAGLVIIVTGLGSLHDSESGQIQAVLRGFVVLCQQMVLLDGGFVQVVGLHAQAVQRAQAVTVFVRAAQVEVLRQRPDALAFFSGRVLAVRLKLLLPVNMLAVMPL